MKIIRRPSTETETMGEWLNDDGSTLCYTIELPWKDNDPQISCIPEGTYIFLKYESPTKGQVWMAQNVPGRSDIELHNANFAYQLRGCLGVGSEIGQIGGVNAVLNSVSTLEELRGILPESFPLTIQWQQATV